MEFKITLKVKLTREGQANWANRNYIAIASAKAVEDSIREHVAQNGRSLLIYNIPGIEIESETSYPLEKEM